MVAFIDMWGGDGERERVYSWSFASNKDNRNDVMMSSEMKKSTLFHDIRLDNGILIHRYNN